MRESEDFWRARESWIASHSAAQTAASKGGVSIPIVRKMAQWAGRGGFYLRKTGLKADIITVDSKLQADMIRWIEQLAPALGEAMDAHLAPLAQEAFDAWPVESGLSKSLVNLEYGVEGGVFFGAITCRAPYTTFIRQPRVKSEDPEAEKKKERIRAIRAAAIAAGKEHTLIRGDSGAEKTGFKGAGRQVYKVLLADKGRATASLIGAEAISKVSGGADG